MRQLLLVVLLIGTAASAQTWIQLSDFPGTARDDAAAFAIGGKIYVGTGMEVGWGLTNDWYQFDGTTGQWSQIASLPASPRQYCAAFVLPSPDGDFGYLFGGLDANGPLNELWRYDPAMNSWTQMASLPSEPRYAAVAFNNGYIATGLFGNGAATNEMWHYEPGTGSWQQLSSMPAIPRHRACGMTRVGLMVIGGADSAYHALADCWTYNTLTDTWSACASLPEGRYGSMCGLAAYDFLLTAGATSDSTIVETAFRYNQTEWWPMIDTYPGGTRRGGILIEGGSGQPGVWHTYTGLGISNDLQRHNDWYVISGAFSVDEHQLGRLDIHPNPVQNTLTVAWPGTWPNAQVRILNAGGRTVLDQNLNQGQPLDVATLRAGHYLVMVRHGSTVLRGYMIKLP